MARSIPAVVLTQLKKVRTQYALIPMVELTHVTWPQPIRLANYTSDIVSNGDTFVGYPFELSLPEDNEQVPKGQITIQNVDRRIGIFLMALSTPPRVRLIVVSTQYPDTRLVDYKRLWLRRIRGNTINITADIDTWDYSTEPWPTNRADQLNAPGLFV